MALSIKNKQMTDLQQDL